MRRFFGAMIEEEVRRLKYHLPKTRKSLRILLKEETPSVETQDGRSILMKKEEITKLSEIVPSHLQDKIQLPIIIQRRFDLGKSIYTVMGNKLEEFTLKKALELTDHDFNEYEEEDTFHIFKLYELEIQYCCFPVFISVTVFFHYDFWFDVEARLLCRLRILFYVLDGIRILDIDRLRFLGL